MRGDFDTLQPVDGGSEEVSGVCGIAHPRRVAKAELVGTGCGEPLGEVQDPGHLHLALVGATERGGDDCRAPKALRHDPLSHDLVVGHALVDCPVHVVLVVRLGGADEDRYLMEMVALLQGVLQPAAVRDKDHELDVVRHLNPV
jgi:hypothetical protein